MTSHVEVALPLPLFTPFTYRIEGPPPEPGTRVLVPFRNRERVGWVVGPADPTGLTGIRSVLSVLEKTPSVPTDLLELARWMSEYYVTPLGVTLRSLTPSVLSDGTTDVVRVTERGMAIFGGEHLPSPATPPQPSRGQGNLLPEPHPPSTPLPPKAREVLAAAAAREAGATVTGIRREVGTGSIWNELRHLQGAGLVTVETLPPPPPPILTRKVVRLVTDLPDLAERERTFGRALRQRECYEVVEAAGGSRELTTILQEDGFSRSVVAGLEERGLAVLEEREVLRDPFQGDTLPEAVDFPLTPHQERALAALLDGLGGVGSPPAPALLHGVTGSGKTLVYIRLLREVVERRGKSAIVLVPEIALTPQTVSRFRGWFGDRVAVLHSALSDGERYDQWRQIRAGEKSIVVGARSALFAPLASLGAIVVDEEHDSSYKQSEAPRYHARDVAVVRARQAGALCVLGSATPSLESWKNAREGKFSLLTLPERAGGRSLPPVEVVDLRKERGKGRGAEEGGSVLSPPLVDAVRETLAREEQAILLLNRRGYASFVQCRGCGEVLQCVDCSVSLTFHRRRNLLLCHHCRHEEEAPRRCPRCGDPELSYRGLGTEQVERVVVETFPGARITRMDVDTTGGKWSHAEILGRVGRREVDILLGTQMIAKGLDFPHVTLVGVVNADVGIHLPDFRASERAFQLLSQVAGRAGRGERGGRVFIQSALPGHYAIQSALAHDYEGFASRELSEREGPGYPPHRRLVNVVVSSPVAELAAAAAESSVAWLLPRLGGTGATLVGPAPSPIERLHGRWRWHFFLKGGRVPRVTSLLRGYLEEAPFPAGDVRASVDRDPVALL